MTGILEVFDSADCIQITESA